MIILKIHPMSIPNMVSFICPADCTTFSACMLMWRIGANRNTTNMYSYPYCMSFSESVNIPRNGFAAMIATIANSTPCRNESIYPSPAALAASSRLFAPRQMDIAEQEPTPKPMANALLKFCMGNTKDKAVIASSSIFATK